ncbi:MAG: hypothetical protein IPK01_13315 [Acidobacteria bacterium]|nr:hypothetical protein [Acidobacteriota bacterium]
MKVLLLWAIQVQANRRSQSADAVLRHSEEDRSCSIVSISTKWDLHDLRSIFAVVLQDVFLFSGTIENNIKLRQ